MAGCILKAKISHNNKLIMKKLKKEKGKAIPVTGHEGP
jgi:hypothetical protein